MDVSPSLPPRRPPSWPDTNARPEDDVARERALQTVVQGQQSENLLDFDADEPEAPGANSLAAGAGVDIISSQQIASAAKSTNPLDELMDLFSTASVAPAAPAQPAGFGGMSGMGAMGGAMGGMSQPTNDFGGLGGLSGLGSPVNPSPPRSNPTSPPPKQPASGTQDLLDLF